ncbi:MAG: ABC transporter transmembrane domain-containing protein [Pseudomonadota bacterium]
MSRTIAGARAPIAKPVDAMADPASPAACLPVLLEQLSWCGDMDTVAEALPYFADTITLVDLRNALVALGYKTEKQSIAPAAIDSRLYPCLYEFADTGKICVLIGVAAEGVYAFIDGRYRPLSEVEAAGSGRVFYVSALETDPTRRQSALNRWFFDVIGRFRASIRQLCLISFVLNILAIATPLFVMTVYDKVIGHSSLSSLGMLAVGAVIALSAEGALRLLKSRLLSALAGRVDFLLGVSTFQKLLRLPIAYTERSGVSSQISRLKEFEGLREFFTGPAAGAVTELPFVLIMVAVVAVIAGPLALVPVAAIILYAGFGALWVRHAKAKEADAGKAGAQHQEFVVESLFGLRTLKNCVAENGWFERFRTSSSAAALTSRNAQVCGAVTDAYSQAVMSFSGMAILALGALMVMGGHLTIGALIATMALTWRILGPIQSAFLTSTRLVQIGVSVGQINRLMSLREEPAQSNSGLLRPELRGRLEFRRVSFRYSNAADPALAGISFVAEPGEIVAVGGACGSGKTTLLKLIMRLYVPQAGAVLMDGMDLRQIDRADLHRHIAYVPQKTDLFYGSLAQNLLMANPSASQTMMEEAAERVGVLDVIRELPDGFDTRLGDRLTDALPKGFTRRLGLARALLSPAALLLLDEPEQNLDAAGDELILRLMEEMRGERTQICVTHRPSYIRIADKAILMNRGMIEDMGDPAQVIDGLFKQSA